MLWFLALQGAHAVDLTTVVVAWEHTETGQAGTDDDDRAMDAALDGSGNLMVVGWLDGTATTGHDAIAVSFDPNGVERWRAVHDTSADAIDPDDRWYGLALDPATGDTVLCGQQGADDRPSQWLVELYTTDLAEQVWRFPFDEGLSSPTQSCRGVDFGDDVIASVGTTWGDDGIAGQWRGIAMQRGAQPLVVGLWTFDPYNDGDVPDEPTEVRVDLGGSWIVTGIEGLGGEPGSPTNDRDGAVQKRLADGRVLWGDTWRPDAPPTLDDRFVDSALSPTTGNVLVVGHENVGGDNDALSDLDGVAVLYDPIGYLSAPVFEWSPEARWEGAGNQSIGAAFFDASGDAYLAGVVDAKGGGEQLRVTQIDPANGGAEVARWEGPPHTAVGLEALIVEDDRVLMAGWVDDGSGPDLYVLQLGIDSDGDGIADSNDGCPDDDDKDDPGVCGCDIPDDDSDGDGLFNCEDGCPSDAEKTEPLVCGCNVSEDDGDGDGFLDCEDECVTDPDKTEPGICGCGTADADEDGDGLVTCRDQCPDSTPGADVDAVGCEVEGDTGDTGPDDKSPADDGGCGCSAASTGDGAALLLPMLILLRLRRRTG